MEDNNIGLKFKAFALSVLMILLPYCLFAFGLAALFYMHTGLFMSYQIPDGFYVLAVFSMILMNVGSAIISPIDLVINVVADIQTPSGPIEVVDYGGGNYSVGERGSAGVGLIILKFIVNVLLTPFMILYWLIVVVLIFIKKNFAKKYLDRIEDFRNVVADGILVVGVVLAAIEFGCVKSRDKQYSPDLFSLESTELVFEYDQVFHDNLAYDVYSFNIVISHPKIDELYTINLQEAKIKYSNEEIDSRIMHISVKDFFTARNSKDGVKKFDCTLTNWYEDYERDGYGYADLEHERFHDYFKLDEIEKSKLEIELSFRDVSFSSGNNYYFVNTGWYSIRVNNNL